MSTDQEQIRERSGHRNLRIEPQTHILFDKRLMPKTFNFLMRNGSEIISTMNQVLSSCTGSQEPIQKTQQCSTAKQRFINKGVQWLFPLCTGTPGHNHES